VFVYFAKYTIDCRGLKMEYVAQRGQVEDLMVVYRWAALVYIVGTYAKVQRYHGRIIEQ